MTGGLEHPDWCDAALLCTAHRQGGRHHGVPWAIHDHLGGTGTVWVEQSPGGEVLALSRQDGTLSAESQGRFDLMVVRVQAWVARHNAAGATADLVEGV